MVDSYRAIRQFERMLPGLADDDRLKVTDPEAYRRKMRNPTVIDTKTSRLIAEVVYDNKNETVTIERTNSKA